MRYGSVCSGIESATVAWHQLGWQPAWFSEMAVPVMLWIGQQIQAVFKYSDSEVA